MIDDDDVDLAILAIPGGGLLITIIGVIIALIIWYIASNNKVECSQKTCPQNTVARLLDGECLCVTTPIH